MARFPRVRKVLWANGSLVTAEHFQFLEEWVEASVGLSIGLSGSHGFFRSSEEFDRNAKDLISIADPGMGTRRTVTLQLGKLRAITPNGRIIDFDPADGTRRDLEGEKPDNQFSLAISEEDGKRVPLFLVVSGEPESPNELEQEPVLRNAEISIDKNLGDRDGFKIAEIEIEDNRLNISEVFVPASVNVFGCLPMENRWQRLCSLLTDLSESVEKKLSILSERVDDSQANLLLYNVACEIRKNWWQKRAVFSNRHLDSWQFLTELGEVLGNFSANLEAVYHPLNLDISTPVQYTKRFLETLESRDSLFDALSAAEIACDSVFSSLSQAIGLGTTVSSRVIAEGHKVKNFQGDRFDIAKVVLENTLREELASRKASRIRIRVRSKSGNLDKTEARVHPILNPVKIEKGDKISAVEGKKGLFEFEHQPSDDELDQNEIVFYVNRDSGIDNIKVEGIL